jgi:D-glycerate 3-kinase
LRHRFTSSIYETNDTYLIPIISIMSTIIDDKSPHVIPFTLTHLTAHLTSPNSARPFILALNGIQGIGKTTLVTALASALAESLRTLEPPSASALALSDSAVLVLSLDDFYLTHADQTALAAANPENALLHQRGEPGTHDVTLLVETFEAAL